MSQKKILLVEDNEFNRKIVHDLLARHPYDLMEAHDGVSCLVADATHKMHGLMVEESFGPILGVAKVADDDEAVRLMNDSPYGLTASIWTRDEERAFRVGSQIDTGTFFMNRCDYLDPQLPWTGVKDSGKGNSLSRYGFLSVTRRKSFHLRTQTQKG